MPYGYRVSGGFWPHVRSALIQAGIGHESPTQTFLLPFGQSGVKMGQGMIVSAGLIRSLHGSDWCECVQKLRCGPGDMRLASCLARFANVGLSTLEGLDTFLSRYPTGSMEALDLHRSRSPAVPQKKR